MFKRFFKKKEVPQSFESAVALELTCSLLYDKLFKINCGVIKGRPMAANYGALPEALKEEMRKTVAAELLAYEKEAKQG